MFVQSETGAPVVVQFVQYVPWIALEYWLGETSGITLFLSALKQMSGFWNLECLKVPSIKLSN